MQKGNVVFRRVGGRVIPIHVDREKMSNAGKGLALAAAGLGAAAVAGGVAGRFARAAAHSENQFKILKGAFRAATGGAKTVAKSQALDSARKMLSAQAGRKAALGVGIFAGGGLIGAGVSKAISGTRAGKEIEKHDVLKYGVPTAISSLAALGVRSGFTYHFADPRKSVVSRALSAIKHAASRVLVRGAGLS